MCLTEVKLHVLGPQETHPKYTQNFIKRGKNCVSTFCRKASHNILKGFAQYRFLEFPERMISVKVHVILQNITEEELDHDFCEYEFILLC